MPNSDAPTPETPEPAPQPIAPKRPSPLRVVREALSQANITTGLAVLAVILAGAPYIVPQIQAFQVRGGLLAQPGMLQTASDKLQAQRAAEASLETAEAVKSRMDSLYKDATDPVIGKPDAPIKMVGFLDYECGVCRATSPQVQQFLADNPDVALIVKEYPVIGKNSRPLAAYALAAAGTPQYEALHYALMETKITSEDDMFAVLKSVGLDPATVQARVNTPAVQDHIDRVVNLGADLSVGGTPTYIIGDTVIPAGANIAAMTAAVEAARKAAKPK